VRLIQLRRGTTVQRMAITPDNGEPCWDEDEKKLYVGDGTTAGGVEVAGGGGTTSPLTTKGDLYTFDTDNARLPVGSDGYILSADSTETTGLKWIPNSGGGSGSGGIAGAYDIEAGGSPTYTDLGLSEEFESGTLNSNWTVAQGSSGSINPIGTVSGAVYDLSGRSKGMLIQTDNTTNLFQMRAAVIASGEQIIISLSIPDSPTTTNNAYVPRLAVSQTTTAFSGTRTEMYLSGSGNSNIMWYPNAAQTAVFNGGRFGARQYFRMVRSGNVFYGFFSVDGTSWVPLGGHTNSTAGYIWIMLGSSAAWTRQSGGDPIACVNWIRHVTYAGLDPW